MLVYSIQFKRLFLSFLKTDLLLKTRTGHSYVSSYSGSLMTKAITYSFTKVSGFVFHFEVLSFQVSL